MYSTIRFDAGHNANGNPRRVYVTFRDGIIIATYDEGYQGDRAIKPTLHRSAYTGVTIKTTPAEYRDLCKFKAP